VGSDEALVPGVDGQGQPAVHLELLVDVLEVDLEGMFLLRRLPPYHPNIQKRLTKSPKIYIRDTGLLHSLAGLDRPEALES
jgi:hypothetical protein